MNVTWAEAVDIDGELCHGTDAIVHTTPEHGLDACATRGVPLDVTDCQEHVVTHGKADALCHCENVR